MTCYFSKSRESWCQKWPTIYEGFEKSAGWNSWSAIHPDSCLGRRNKPEQDFPRKLQEQQQRQQQQQHPPTNQPTNKQTKKVFLNVFQLVSMQNICSSPSPCHSPRIFGWMAWASMAFASLSTQRWRFLLCGLRHGKNATEMKQILEVGSLFTGFLLLPGNDSDS